VDVEGRRAGTRTALATATAVLAVAGIAAAMLLAGTSGITLAVTVALVGVQVGLLLGVRRGAVRTRRFLLAWSAQAGLTYPLAGDPGLASALVYLCVGLVFAVVVMVGLALTRPVEQPPARESHGDTQPLPVADAA
jgi:hypothetical protein